MQHGKTLKIYSYVCSCCNTAFESDSKGKLIASKKNHAVYCSEACQLSGAKNHARNYKGRHVGVCKHCGSTFTAKKQGKIYCSLKCYVEDPDAIERLRQHNEAQASQRPPCRQCGEKTQTKHKFCSHLCRRKYHAERFDRFIANPETLALPQNYDEFFCQDELPCIIEGCDWVGHRLGQHCNIVHGIDVVKLRELAGFNRSTGTVSAIEQQRMSVQGKRLVEEGKSGQAFIAMVASMKNGEREWPVSKPSGSLEAKEHRRKASALRGAVVVTRVCTACSVEYQSTSLAHGSVFCSVKCRTAVAKEKAKQGIIEAKCSYCGETFMANKFKAKRVAAGLKVTCSDVCRNRMNMATCLSRRLERNKNRKQVQ